LLSRCESHASSRRYQTEAKIDYIAYLHKDRHSDFGVSFPDFPGCITAGKTLEEARRRAAEALSLHIAGMAEDGEKIPDPSTVDDVRNDPAIKGAVAFLVPAHLERTVRINITARESQIEKIDLLARKAGLTRSAYVVQAALKQAGVKTRTKWVHRLQAKKLRETRA
jgi:predicted RNase H-like HicB family nuclease